MGPKKWHPRLFKAKEGLDHELFFTAFDIILASIVLLALYNFVTDAVELTLFEKHYVARDTALLINALYAAPADVTYTYAEKLDGFSIDFSRQRVSIIANSQKDTPIFYPYSENAKRPVSYSPSSANPYMIVFTTENDKVKAKSEALREEAAI